MKHRYLLLVVLVLTTPLFGQNKLKVHEYDWNQKPNYDLNVDNDVPLISLKEQYMVEFAYSNDNSFIEYYLEHKAILLNSNEKIEAFNKIYLPFSEESELLESKARVITKEGRVIDLDESKIFSAKDEETGKNYKYFAFEGVEKGSVIEYLYIERKAPSYSGTALRLQSSYDKKNVTFELFSPTHLIFDFKSYNGLPEMVKDTSLAKLHWVLSLDELKGLQEDEQSAYNASRGYVVYKLDRNLNNNTRNISSYGTVARNIHNFYYTEPEKKAQKLMVELLEGFSGNQADTEALIRQLDRYIKTGFTVSEGNDEKLKDLEEVLRNKVVNQTGLIKLYVALLNHLEIVHEIVLTSDRESIKFDKDFESHNFLTDFLIYFPEFDTYLSPSDMGSRYAFPPAELTDNYGLFIREVKVGDFRSAIGEVKYIDPLEAAKTVDKMVIEVKFDENNISSNMIKLQRSFSGYYALPIHPYIELVVGEDRDELIEGLAKTMNENVRVEDSNIINANPELFGVEPITFEIVMSSDAFVEKAGNKYLFKIGELIGRQIQMYQEKERVLPFENDFNRSYYRTLHITLPKGYRIANAEDLNIKNTYSNNGEELFSFESFYKIQDNVLRVTADEHYRLNIIEPMIFEEFRKVINSAADFNKITLVLEPIG